MERIYVITENGIVEKTDSEMDYIREISSKDELEELMERMPYIQTIQAPNSKLRKELYTLAMKEYDDVEWVRVIKSVYLRKQDKRYDDYEPDYMEKAKQFLYGEIAVQFDVPHDKVEDFVNETVEKYMKEF